MSAHTLLSFVTFNKRLMSKWPRKFDLNVLLQGKTWRVTSSAAVCHMTLPSIQKCIWKTRVFMPATLRRQGCNDKWRKLWTYFSRLQCFASRTERKSSIVLFFQLLIIPFTLPVGYKAEQQNKSHADSLLSTQSRTRTTEKCQGAGIVLFEQTSKRINRKLSTLREEWRKCQTVVLHLYSFLWELTQSNPSQQLWSRNTVIQLKKQQHSV